MKSSIILAALAFASAAPLAAQAPASTPLTTKSGTIGQPPAGSGQVVFFRPGSLMGMALGCTVHEGEAEIARLGSGKYYVVTATPGKHAYSTRGEAKDELRLEVEPGETYFVKCKIGAGIMAGRANLSPADEAEFSKKAQGLKMWERKDKNAG